jgi:hypothetical protein
MVRVYIYIKKNIYCIVYTVYTPKCSWSGREAGISTTFYYELGLISNWAFQKLIEGGIQVRASRAVYALLLVVKYRPI